MNASTPLPPFSRRSAPVSAARSLDSILPRSRYLSQAIARCSHLSSRAFSISLLSRSSRFRSANVPLALSLSFGKVSLAFSVRAGVTHLPSRCCARRLLTTSFRRSLDHCTERTEKLSHYLIGEPSLSSCWKNRFTRSIPPRWKSRPTFSSRLSRVSLKTRQTIITLIAKLGKVSRIFGNTPSSSDKTIPQNDRHARIVLSRVKTNDARHPVCSVCLRHADSVIPLWSTPLYPALSPLVWRDYLPSPSERFFTMVPFASPQCRATSSRVAASDVGTWPTRASPQGEKSGRR